MCFNLIEFHKRFLGKNDTKHTNMTETDDERKRGEMLLKKLKSANEKLHNACLFGDRLLLEEAITDGAEVGLPFASSVGEEDEFGTGKMHSLLPLHCAARNNHSEICLDLILRFACEVDGEDERDGRTALFHAIAMDRVDVVRVLVGKCGANG